MGYLKDDDLITRTEMQKIWEARWAMDKEPELSEVYYEGIPWDESDAPSTEAVTPETATESVAPDDANANPNSAPQTPVESSLASANAGSSAANASAEINANASGAESVGSGDTAPASVGS